MNKLDLHTKYRFCFTGTPMQILQYFEGLLKHSDNLEDMTAYFENNIQPKLFITPFSIPQKIKLPIKFDKKYSEKTQELIKKKKLRRR